VFAIPLLVIPHGTIPKAVSDIHKRHPQDHQDTLPAFDIHKRHPQDHQDTSPAL
jgi:hypothetical protein